MLFAAPVTMITLPIRIPIAFHLPQRHQRHRDTFVVWRLIAALVRRVPEIQPGARRVFRARRLISRSHEIFRESPKADEDGSPADRAGSNVPSRNWRWLSEDRGCGRRLQEPLDRTGRVTRLCQLARYEEKR